MENYLLLLCVTLEQESSIQQYFNLRNWTYRRKGLIKVPESCQRHEVIPFMFDPVTACIYANLGPTMAGESNEMSSKECSQTVSCQGQNVQCLESSVYSTEPNVTRTTSPVIISPCAEESGKLSIKEESRTTLGQVDFISEQYTSDSVKQTEFLAGTTVNTSNKDVSQFIKHITGVYQTNNSGVTQSNLEGGFQIYLNDAEIHNSDESNNNSDEVGDVYSNLERQDSEISYRKDSISDSKIFQSNDIENKMHAEDQSSDESNGRNIAFNMQSSTTRQYANSILKVTENRVMNKELLLITKESPLSFAEYPNAQCPGTETVLNSAVTPTSIDSKRETNSPWKQKNNTYYCEDCKTNFKFYRSFLKHKKNGKCVFECHFCGKVFTSRKYHYFQNVHLRYHKNERLYKCHLCDKTFVEECKRKMHIKSAHEGVKLIICDICGKQFSQAYLLARHIEVMHTESVCNLQCDLCGLRFKSVRYLNYHKRFTHSGERPFSCPVCQKKFKRSHVLKRHLETHTEHQGFTCQICGKSFTKKEYLRKHSSRHSGKRSFICEICNRGFAERSKLRQHVRIHTGEKPYSCPQCQYRCAVRGNLAKHMKTHISRD